MSTEAPSALRAGACPDPEVLAAYIDGQLAPAERTTIERHLSECPECRDVVAGSVEVIDEIGGGAVPRRSRTALWIGLGAVLAAAAAVVIAVRVNQPAPYYVPEMQDLVAAVGGNRPVEPRLTGGFAYGPYVVTRGDEHRPSMAALAAAAHVEERAKQGDAASRAALGVAQLTVGDGRAMQTLQDAANRAPTDARIRSDLAAAYYVAGRRLDDARLLAKALDNAEQAVAAAPRSPEALFNRALSLEALGLTERAKAAWNDYLAVDPSSGWAEEARRRRAALATTGLLDLDQLRRRFDRAAKDVTASATLRELAREQPFRAHEADEATLLKEWAQAILHNDATAAQSVAAAAQRLAGAIAESSGDRFAVDVWAHVAHVGDPFRMARAVVLYADGREALDNYRTAAADRSLAQAEPMLERLGSPLAVSVRFLRTLPAYYRREYSEATASLDGIAAVAARRRYLSLAGQTEWRRGLIYEG